MGRKPVSSSKAKRELNRKIGANFSELRESLGLRQDVVAKRAGISQSQLSRFESGKGPLSDEQSTAALNVLGEEIARVHGGQSSEQFQAMSPREKEAHVQRLDRDMQARMAKQPGPHASDGCLFRKKRRRSKSITQAQLAERMTQRGSRGINQSVVSGYENGYIEFLDDQVRAYDAALDSLIAELPPMHEIFVSLSEHFMPDPELNPTVSIGGVVYEADTPEKQALANRLKETKKEQEEIESKLKQLSIQPPPQEKK